MKLSYFKPLSAEKPAYCIAAYHLHEAIAAAEILRFWETWARVGEFRSALSARTVPALDHDFDYLPAGTRPEIGS